MININEERLVITSGLVEVHGHHFDGPYDIAADGTPFVVPVTGGIHYNVRVGATAYGWAADHVEPGVVSVNSDKETNYCMNNLACIGNEATVVSGDAKGDKGVVTGKHGGAEHIIIDFPQETLEKLVYGDKIMIRFIGRGLDFLDYPDIKTLGISPRLVKAMNLRDGKDGKLIAPVVALVPSLLMGSGIGMTSERGDYDIMTMDKEAILEYGLDKLRLGDLVALIDQDNMYGRTFRRGAITIGIIIHGDSRIAGHGPGVTTLFGAATPLIEPVIDPGANIADLLGLGKN
ncbi:MAG: DUF4438 domain-containing protein [Anaerolineales bacterium]|nr:DUF4438 domain-containing protein [Anaerolineales bacterium]